MSVSMTMSQVSNALGLAKPKYEEVCTNLKNAYKRMDKLYTYWGGNLYNIIKENWNGQVKDLERFMKTTAAAYKATSIALLAYSRAENDPIDKGEVNVLTLGTMKKSDKDKLKATSVIIRADKALIVGQLQASKQGIEEVFKYLTTIEASSPSIDELKSRMRASKEPIISNLESIIKDIGTNMETAAKNYEEAEKTTNSTVN